MRIVLDTNIVFSAILNSNSNIGKIILDATHQHLFFTPNFLKFEISNHWNKLKKISKLSDRELETSYLLIISRINFINEELIPKKIWHKSESILKNIDIDDIPFVALAKYLKAILWTGDKVLVNGMKKDNYIKILTTQEIMILFENK